MFETIITTIISSALFVTSSAFAPVNTAPEVVFTQTLPEKNFISYTVGEAETLADVSKKHYGSEDFWTNIWNDNPAIADPENVEKDTILKIRATAPSEAAELETVLADRESALEDEKNVDYLKSIGYLTDDKPAVTVTPTAAPVVTQAPVATTNAASPISEEAITYLGNCEAGNDPAKNTGNGYYGAFQFSAGTWNSMNTGYARADLAPLDVQKAAVKQLLQRSSIHNQFPGCAAKMRGAGLI